MYYGHILSLSSTPPHLPPHLTTWSFSLLKKNTKKKEKHSLTHTTKTKQMNKPKNTVESNLY